MLTIVCLLWLLAAVLAVLSGTTSRVPVWIPVFLASLAGLLGCYPVR